MDEKKSRIAGLPLARALSLTELRGGLGKKFEVPVGRRGITIDREGNARLLESGSHRVLNALGRLTGKGAGLWVGYVPDAPFAGLLKVTNLLSGDDELVDFSLLCDLQVSDAARFFQEEVIPRKVLSSATFILDEGELFTAFANLVGGYSALDLIDGRVNDDLTRQASKILQPILKNVGLEFRGVNLVTCWRQSDRVRIEQKIFELDQKLVDLEMEKQFASAEDRVEFTQFMREIDPDWLDKARITVPDGPAQNKRFMEILRAWVSGEKNENQPGSSFRLKALWKGKRQAEVVELEPYRDHKNWWLPRTMWIMFLILLGTGLSAFINYLSGPNAEGVRWELYGAIWVFVIGAILESVRRLYLKWEERLAAQPDLEKVTVLDDLSRNNRAVVDSLVRDQCALDLGMQRDILNEIRSRVYRMGNEDFALEIREVERKLEDSQADIWDTSFGSAPYLRPDLKISRRQWETMLDEEERLLIQVADLTEDCHLLQTKLASEALEETHLRAYEVKLNDFIKNFKARQRALRPTETDLERYRQSNRDNG